MNERNISAGVPQGSILILLLFNIFINDIFLLLQKRYLANYADDRADDKRVSTIIDSLRHEFTILSKWFYNNFMVRNPEKRSFMLLGVDDPLQTNLVYGDQILEKKYRKNFGCNIRQYSTLLHIC